MRGQIANVRSSRASSPWVSLRGPLPPAEDEAAYGRMAEFRRRRPPYCDRRLHVLARLSRREAVYVIRDEGPGFDPTTLPDPTDPAHLERTTGRGLILIRAFMDGVSFNGAGNAITLLKRRAAPPNAHDR